MTTNNERLRELMKAHSLTRADVAKLLHLAITKNGQTPAVAKWLAKPTDKNNYRPLKDSLLELLELKLGEREVEVFRANE